MNDMAPTIIPKSDQLNSDDLITGPITITITGVDIRSGQEQPISIHYEGDGGKPYKACKSMCRVMVSAWGPDSKKYAGRSMTLYRDPKVKWAGMEVGGIRISHMSDIDESMTMALTVTRANKKPFTVKPIVMAQSKAAAQTSPSVALADSSTSLDAAGSAAAAPTITADEVLALEARCTENNIKVGVVKKHFAVERFSQMTGEQLAQAHQMIDSTIEQRKAAA